MTEEEQRQAAFYEEYAALVRKHRVVMNSCGCCGGPFLSPEDANEGACTNVELHLENVAP